MPKTTKPSTSTTVKKRVPRKKPAGAGDTLDIALPSETAAATPHVAASCASLSQTQEESKTVLEEVLETLRTELRVSVEDGDFTDPNRRTLKLFLGKKCISQTSFDVRSRREYEG